MGLRRKQNSFQFFLASRPINFLSPLCHLPNTNFFLFFFKLLCTFLFGYTQNPFVFHHSSFTQKHSSLRPVQTSSPFSLFWSLSFGDPYDPACIFFLHFPTFSFLYNNHILLILTYFATTAFNCFSLRISLSLRKFLGLFLVLIGYGKKMSNSHALVGIFVGCFGW